LFHAAPHFFLGLGPDVSTQFIAKAGGNDGIKQTSFGLLFTVGGWF
jgi:hypothetical protein